MIDLHERALELAKVYKKTEIELIDILQKIDHEKLFRKLGYTSLFDYCHLGLLKKCRFLAFLEAEVRS
jgi:hypothetical protein